MSRGTFFAVLVVGSNTGGILRDGTSKDFIFRSKWTPFSGTVWQQTRLESRFLRGDDFVLRVPHINTAHTHIHNNMHLITMLSQAPEHNEEGPTPSHHQKPSRVEFKSLSFVEPMQ